MLLTNSREKATSFGLKASAKAFKILSSGIYKHKIRAVVREISCNAADSHTMAGCADLPFSVHAPSRLEPWFSVTDYGVGLSDDDVLHLYTTYFDSNKKADDSGDEFSDLFTGGMGLGSKSPLAYTDQYMVHSWHGGYKRSYNAYMLETGQPDIKKIAEVKLKGDEATRTGFEVYVPVRENDIRDWRIEIERVLRMFTVVPTVVGDNIDVTSIVAGWEDYKFLERANVSHVWMGNVAYPLCRADIHTIFDKLGKLDYVDLFSDIVRPLGEPIIKFPLNSFDFQPSREEIDLTEKTIAAIGAKLCEIVDTVVKDAQAGLDAFDAAGGVRLCDYKHKYRKLVLDNAGQFTRFGIKLLELTLYKEDAVVAWAGADAERIEFLADSIKVRSKRSWYTRHDVNRLFCAKSNTSHVGPVQPSVESYNYNNYNWHKGGTTVLVHDQRSHVIFYADQVFKDNSVSEVVVITQTKNNAHLVEEILQFFDPRWCTIVRTSELVSANIVPPKAASNYSGKKSTYLTAAFTPSDTDSVATYKSRTLEMYAEDLKDLATDPDKTVYYAIANRSEDWVANNDYARTTRQLFEVLSLANTAMTVVLVSPSKEKTAINAGLSKLCVDTIVKSADKTTLANLVSAYEYKNGEYSRWRYGRTDIAIAVLSAEPSMSKELAAYQNVAKYTTDPALVKVVEQLTSCAINTIRQLLPKSAIKQLDITGLTSCNIYGQDKLNYLLRTKYPLACRLFDSEADANDTNIQHALQYIAMIQNQETSR